MAASHRKGPRKRQQQSKPQAMLWIGMAAALIIMSCLCMFSFEMKNGNNNSNNSNPRLETCRSTCDARLQSAALESHVPSTLSPSAVDTLFSLRDVNNRHSSFHGRAEPPSKAPTAPGQQQQSRPRRLPTLIKILTGFGDEPSSSPAGGSSNDLIARTEQRPNFAVPQVQKQQKRGGGKEPLSHEDTVQIAAAAAAAAVFSKSMRLFGNNRMHRVNAEWDAALRWIAGWDQQQRQQPPMRADNEGSNTGGATSKDEGGDNNTQEGFNSFVDDLARMLESCIRKCVEDDRFEFRTEKGDAGQSIMAVGSALVLRSLLGWVVGVSFPKLSFGNLGTISPEIGFIVGRAFQLVASSVAMYALHALWAWASPAILHWYSSLGYSESPEWLLEHEKDIQRAKTSSARKKKKKRKQNGKQPDGRSRMAQSNGRIRKERLVGTRTSVEDGPETERDTENVLANSSDNPWRKARASGNGAGLDPTTETTLTTCKDSVSDSQGSSTLEGIPSVISYQSTSISSSPSMKPIGSHLEVRDMPYGSVGLQGTMSSLNSQFGHKGGSLFRQLSNQKPPLVPTQEQRIEAAKQLREFQNAQVQRILLQRKLSQQNSKLSENSVILSVPQVSRLISPQTSRLLTAQNSALTQGNSFHSTGTAPSGMVPVQQSSNVLRPPPGLSHPSEAAHTLNTQQLPSKPMYDPDQLIQEDDKSFLADNELLISRLLDDDDEEVDDVEVPSFLDVRFESMSPELSLDPSAAPFVGKSSAPSMVQAAFPKTEIATVDAWQSGPSDLLKGSSPVRMKGVYGGSVW